MAVDLRGLNTTVAAAGTPVPVSATSIKAPGCTIRANPTNVGTIYVGGVNLGLNTRAAELNAGDAIEIVGPNIGGTEEEIDLSKIYIDSSSSGDKVTVAYFVRS